MASVTQVSPSISSPPPSTASPVHAPPQPSRLSRLAHYIWDYVKDIFVSLAFWRTYPLAAEDKAAVDTFRRRDYADHPVVWKSLQTNLENFATNATHVTIEKYKKDYADELVQVDGYVEQLQKGVASYAGDVVQLCLGAVELYSGESQTLDAPKLEQQLTQATGTLVQGIRADHGALLESKVTALTGEVANRIYTLVEAIPFHELWDTLVSGIAGHSAMIQHAEGEHRKEIEHLAKAKRAAAARPYDAKEAEAQTGYKDDLEVVREVAAGREDVFLRQVFLTAFEECTTRDKHMVSQAILAMLGEALTARGITPEKHTELEEKAICTIMEKILKALFPAADGEIDVYKLYKQLGLDDKLQQIDDIMGVLKEALPQGLIDAGQGSEGDVRDAAVDLVRQGIVQALGGQVQAQIKKFAVGEELKKLCADNILPAINSQILGKLIEAEATGRGKSELAELAEELCTWHGKDEQIHRDRREAYCSQLVERCMAKMHRYRAIFVAGDSPLDDLKLRAQVALDTLQKDPALHSFRGRFPMQCDGLLQILQSDPMAEQLSPLEQVLAPIEREILKTQLTAMADNFLKPLETLMTEHAARHPGDALNDRTVNSLLQYHYSYQSQEGGDHGTWDALITRVVFDHGGFGGSVQKRLYTTFAEATVGKLVADACAELRESPFMLFPSITGQLSGSYGTPDKVHALLFGESVAPGNVQARFKWQIRQMSALAYDMTMFQCNWPLQVVVRRSSLLGSSEAKLDKVITNIFNSFFFNPCADDQGQRILNVAMVLQLLEGVSNHLELAAKHIALIPVNPVTNNQVVS